jgi:hypothetical protein
VTTAREQLLGEVRSLSSQRGAPLRSAIARIMGQYRVQTKPGTDVGTAPTARDALGDRIIDVIEAAVDVDQKLGVLIDLFRMQTKTAGGPSGPTESPSSTSAPVPKAKPTLTTKAPASASSASSPSSSPARKPAALPAPALAAKPAPANTSIRLSDPPPKRAPEPAVHGGPRARRKQRGECPKCHSLGVVLARSYSGDDYYSCIYCGWQTFKPVDESDPNVSLAVRLLGQTLGND